MHGFPEDHAVDSSSTSPAKDDSAEPYFPKLKSRERLLKAEGTNEVKECLEDQHGGSCSVADLDAFVTTLLDDDAPIAKAARKTWFALLGHLLCISAEWDAPPAVSALLTGGAPVKSVDGDGCSPLWFASANGNTSLVEELIKHKALLNRQDHEGVTLSASLAKRGGCAAWSCCLRRARMLTAERGRAKRWRGLRR